jgi:hypothetical protein
MYQKRNDQVFQLSLTEIALILVFLLMLLLGWLTKAALKDAKEARADLEEIPNALIVISELERAKEELRKAIERANIADPEKLFEDLVRYSSIVGENKKLETELSKANEELKDLTNVIDSLGGKDAAQAAKDIAQKIGSGMDIKDPKLLNEKIKELADQAQKIEDLMGQNEYLVQRAGKGFGIQPCWIENGRTQNLLDVVMEPEGVQVRIPSNLSPSRLKQMQDLPGIELASRNFIPYEELEKSFGPILAWSKKQEPECRHYVSIKSNIALTKVSTPKRLQITGYFYPDEYK